jgi:hypothetical protein
MMALAYERFAPSRPLSQYVGQAGLEQHGLALSPSALSALAESKSSDLPCELVVIGAWVRGDGMRYLDFGVPTDYIEATTDYRYDHDAKRLRLICPLCDLKDGRHTKGCDAR